jgi:hypothetical protein
MKSILAWFSAAACFVLAGAFTAWLGLWGPVLSAAEADGWYGLAKQWQTLTGALVAIFAAWIAWVNVGRTLKLQRSVLAVTLMSREEDRLEKELPGLKEAAIVLGTLTKELQRLGKNKREILCARVIVKKLPMLPDTSIEHNVQRVFPSASDQLRQQICDALRYLIETAERLIALHKRISDIKRKLRSSLQYVVAEIVGAEPPELSDEQKVLNGELQVLERVFADERILLRGRIDVLEKFVAELRERIRSIDQRIPKFRHLIESFLDQA